MTVRIGVDTGGTFTDLVLLDEETGARRTVKVPSTPARSATAVFEALARCGVPAEEVESFVLGTTIATNCLLERKGQRVVYVTTAGFEDVPYIQRINRRHLFDLQWVKATPYVARRDCLGVRERIAYDGLVQIPLEPAEVERVVADLVRRDAESDSGVAIALNLLFAFTDPTHERLLADAIRQALPQAPLAVSHEVAPVWREYERGNTAIVDAYLRRLVGRFADELESGLGERGVTGSRSFLKSNGGQVPMARAARQPAALVLSGLAGGLIAGKVFADAIGARRVITLDMGGTSADVGGVVDGRIRSSSHVEFEWGLPIAAPVVDLSTIGAGGSSIAGFDQGGFLTVGPESAGADPGPAAYGRGGTAATVTDANLVLGRLNPDYFLGGELQLDVERARRALEPIAERLGTTLEDAAQAVVEVAGENMANAIRLLAADRGLDYRRFELMAFGGAGPLHAAQLARRVGLAGVIVPPSPGLASAFGALAADLRVDRRLTRALRSDLAADADLRSALEQLAREALEELRLEGGCAEPVLALTVSCRYQGQNFEQDVPVTLDTGVDLVRLTVERFHAAHERAYGYRIEEAVVEFVHLSAVAIEHRPPVVTPALEARGEAEPAGTRPVYFKGHGWVETPIYRRTSLGAGTTLPGPAIVEEVDSTTLVLVGQIARVHPTGALLLAEEPAPVRVAGEAERGRVVPDPVWLTILHSQFVNICEEMAVATMRTAYSPIFNEGLDFSCLILDRNGDLMAMANMNPAMLGQALFSGRWVIDDVGAEEFEPGDVIVHNDPYRGGSHMPEHLLVTPFHYHGELRGFLGVVGHVGEIGGMAPGSFSSNATEIYQEGLRLPPIKLMRGGEPVHEVWRIMLANHRTPDTTWGDFNAMIGALKVGERRLAALYDDYGPKQIEEGVPALFDYAETWMRRDIAALPDGTYSAEDCQEDDGFANRPYVIRVDVTIADERMIVDYSRTDEQARGVINGPYVVTASATYNGIFQVIGSECPINAGAFRPIDIIAPPGTVVNVRHPGPCVGGQTELQPRLLDLMQGRILSQIVPEQTAAASGGTSCNFLFGGTHPRTGQYYTHYNWEGIGWGGRATTDGNNAQIVPHGNCQNTPIEVFETRYPWLHAEYRLNPNSGGPGRTRGGLGITRVMSVEADEIVVSALCDRSRVAPWGLFGGGEGACTAFLVRRSGSGEFQTFSEAFGTASDTKFSNVRLRRGDAVLLRSPSGGGYGPPLERAPEQVAADVREGFVSRESACELYRVVVREDGSVDEPATEVLRAAAPAPAAAGPGAVAHPAPHTSEPLPASGVGRWVERHESWHRTEVQYCEVTGQLLPRRYWSFEHAGREIRARDPHAEELFREFVLPRRGGRRARPLGRSF